MTVGQEIKRAFAYVRDVSSDALAMLKIVDDEMKARGLSLLKEPEPLDAVIYAGYSAASKTAPSRELRGIELQFLPSFSDEAVVVLFRAEFEDEKLPSDMYKAWSDIGAALGAHLVVGKDTVFSGIEATAAIKGVRTLVAHPIRLADVTDRNAVRDVVAVTLVGL